MSKIIDYIEQPSYFNLEKFCIKYLELSESYWGLANEEQSSAINKAKSDIFTAKVMQNLPSNFKGMDDNQIQAHFHNLKINLYKNIDKNISDIIKNEIDKFLKKNIVYANKLKLKIPKDENLQVKEYYINYIVVQKILPYISMKAKKGLKR